MNREEPIVASQLSECLGAGTGCQWCVPFLCQLHEQWTAGEEPSLPEDADAYASGRKAYRVERRNRPSSTEE